MQNKLPVIKNFRKNNVTLIINKNSCSGERCDHTSIDLFFLYQCTFGHEAISRQE